MFQDTSLRYTGPRGQVSPEGWHLTPLDGLPNPGDLTHTLERWSPLRRRETSDWSDVAESGLGLWARSQATGNRSSGLSSSPVTGHRFSEACSAFSMRRRSKRWPVFRLTTGCWGISPEMAQYIFLCLFLCCGGVRRGSLALGDVQARPCWQALAAQLAT